MMNYEIFKEVVKEKFMDYMPEKFKGMELVVEPVEKVNVTLDGIILREEGRNISPTIYINVGMATAVAISLKANFCMVRSMPYFTMKAKKPRVTT